MYRWSRLGIAIALIVGARNAAAQSEWGYIPHWIEETGVRLFQVASDSTVLEMTVHAKPKGRDVDGGIVFARYKVRCGDGRTTSTYAVTGVGSTERAAMRASLPTRFLAAPSAFDDGTGAMIFAACVELDRPLHPLPASLGPSVSDNRAESGYAEYWNKDGDAKFLRADSDSSVVTVDVHYAPYAGNIRPSALFKRWFVRCNGLAESVYTDVATSVTETSVLLRAPRSHPFRRPMEFEGEAGERMLDFACVLIDARRHRDK